MPRKKTSKKRSGNQQQIIFAVVIGLLISLVILLGIGVLKLGAWYLPANQITVDTEGIHFWSGNTGSITWTLENELRNTVFTLTTTGSGNYGFALPATSGKYHIYCTASGCDAGEWILIDLNNVPLSPASTIISGLCIGTYSNGNEYIYKCSGESRLFTYITAVGEPARFMCNTCTSRNVYNVAGVNTQAIIISAPPMPTPTSTPIQTLYPTPIQSPAPTSMPPLTQTPTPTPSATATPQQTPESTKSTPVVTTYPPPTETSPQATPVRTEQVKPTTTVSGTTPTTKSTPFIGIAGITVAIFIAYLIIKRTKRKEWQNQNR